ncbi:hypothetical protein SLS64_011717 [Diaporthe eres]|uniref:Uncharacterized protein n=1 Tax=Diaporthe eres TaxID=83184 RepID=A0ABR1PIN2_DIAER
MLGFIVAGLLTSQFGLCAPDTSTDDQRSVTWIYPKGGEVFHQLDTVNVSYQSSYPEPWLYTFCYENETANTVRQIRMQEAEPNDASMLILMNFTTLTSCWFNLRKNTSSNTGSNTKKWSLTEIKRQSGPITTGAPLPSTTTTTSLLSSSSSSTASTSASASTSANASVSSNDDLSTGAKAGLGIGVGIGTALLCAGAFWLYYRHVKRKEHHQEVYRRIVGGQGGAAAPGQDGFTTPSEHLEPWRYGSTPQPAPSAAGSAYSGASDHSSDWYSSQATFNAPYQYYDPVGSSHHVPAVHPHRQPPSVLTTASMTAEPPSSIVRDLGTPRAEHVPEAAAIRDVQDLNSSLYPSEYNEPVSPVSADRDVPPPRTSSVNYGPMGRLDASTGADFTLLPDYTPSTGGDDQREDEDDIYGPPTPRSPPPPHSAHAHIANEHLPQQQPMPPPHQVTQEHAWQSSSHSASTDVVELPTAQTHHVDGPRAELPAGDGRQLALRQQPSDLRGPEQKFLLQDMARLRTEQHRDGG